ncbi:DCL family protein [Sphingobium estronivorans]|uniref:DCL family protein n=1 Tax=Sphingobium estronivorans TaxID=1577690 RepID=UPI00123BC593|nr:DCL family protein [Sphingobium estronivorans]
MGKARSITLSTRSFDKAGDATAFFAAMLNRYDIGDRVHAEDATDLRALLARHDEFEEKVGTGIDGFEVNTPPQDVPQFSKRCFWVVRSDGTKIDFSIGHCLQRKPYEWPIYY